MNENSDITYLDKKKLSAYIYFTSDYIYYLLNDMILYSNNSQSLNLIIEELNIMEMMEFMEGITRSLIAVFPGNKSNVKVLAEINKEILKKYNFYSDKTRLNQAILNLISNSVKFTKFGEIKIIFNVKTDPEKQKPCLSIIIKDTGIGIKPDDLKLIQDNIFSSNKNKSISINTDFTYNEKGTGIGLGITKTILSKLKHTLIIKSEYTKGTIAEILIDDVVEKIFITDDKSKSSHNSEDSHDINDLCFIAKNSNSKLSHSINLNIKNTNKTNHDPPIINNNLFIQKNSGDIFDEMSGKDVTLPINFDKTEMNMRFIKNNNKNYYSFLSKRKGSNLDWLQNQDIILDLNDENKDLETKLLLRNFESQIGRRKNTLSNIKSLCNTSKANVNNIISKARIQRPSFVVTKKKKNALGFQHKNILDSNNSINKTKKKSLSDLKDNKQNTNVINNYGKIIIQHNTYNQFPVYKDNNTFINHYKEEEIKENKSNANIIDKIEEKIKNNSLSCIIVDRVNTSHCKYNSPSEKNINNTHSFSVDDKLNKTNSLSSLQDYVDNLKHADVIEINNNILNKIGSFEPDKFITKTKMNNDSVMNSSDFIVLKQRIKSTNNLNILEVNNKNKILLVDDTETIRRALKKMLLSNEHIKSQFNVIEAKDGIELLNYVINDQAQGNKIKLIITDENMEYMSGSSAISIIRQLENEKKVSKIYIASLTAFSDEATIKGITSKGADAIFIKPISKLKLSQLIEFSKII